MKLVYKLYKVHKVYKVFFRLYCLFVFVRQLSAGGVNIFSFTASHVNHDIFALEEPDKLIPVRVGAVAIGGVVNLVVLDNVDFYGELPTE